MSVLVLTVTGVAFGSLCWPCPLMRRSDAFAPKLRKPLLTEDQIFALTDEEDGTSLGYEQPKIPETKNETVAVPEAAETRLEDAIPKSKIDIEYEKDDEPEEEEEEPEPQQPHHEESDALTAYSTDEEPRNMLKCSQPGLEYRLDTNRVRCRVSRRTCRSFEGFPLPTRIYTFFPS
jgi:hypothetical protein